MYKALRRYMASTIAEEVKAEIDRAEEASGSFHSLHAGLTALREEYKKLEDTIFWGVGEDGDTTVVRNEAIQVAATAMRIVMQRWSRSICRTSGNADLLRFLTFNP